MVYLLTPTGGRPEGLALLGEYINAQTYSGPATWVIVDDCDPASRIPKARDGIMVEVVRPEWRWEPGDNTQAKSMSAGLERIPADAVVFVAEDDDVYLPSYIDTMLKALESVDMVGERNALYYNAATRRYKEMPTPRHSSLASTVVKGKALAALKLICAQGAGKFIDMRLWKTAGFQRKLIDTANVVGIKGLPGRSGIGAGHKPNFGVQGNMGVLQLWIGEQRAQAYERFAEKPDRIKARRETQGRAAPA